MTGMPCSDSKQAVVRVATFGQDGPRGVQHVFRRILCVFQDKADFPLVPCIRVIWIARIRIANVALRSISRSSHDIGVVNMDVVPIVILPTESPALVKDSISLAIVVDPD